MNKPKVVHACLSNMKIHSSCEIEDFVETHLCKLCVILLRSRVVVVVVLTLSRIVKSVVTGQAPFTLELRNTPGKNTHNPRWYTHISQLTQFMSPPETYKSEIGSQATMCKVQAGAYVSLLTPGETNYSDCHPRKTTTYILHVVSITTHTHDRRKSRKRKQRKEEKMKERKEERRKRNKTKKARKEKKKTRKARKLLYTVLIGM